jgi:hypothetical protein
MVNVAVLNVAVVNTAVVDVTGHTAVQRDSIRSNVISGQTSRSDLVHCLDAAADARMTQIILYYIILYYIMLCYVSYPGKTLGVYSRPHSRSHSIAGRISGNFFGRISGQGDMAGKGR